MWGNTLLNDHPEGLGLPIANEHSWKLMGTEDNVVPSDPVQELHHSGTG